MSNQDLKNQVIEWLQKQPYWIQYLGNFLLEGGEINEEVAATVYRLYKEDVGLEPQGNNPAVNFNKMVAEGEDVDPTLVLQSIKDIHNVNALAEGQAIKIGPRLTLIYGNNGTGKSGYVRLLNNVFSSRGDKEILPNVFKPEAGDPECKFTFMRTEEPYDLTFPADRSSYEFAQFAVFDTKSVREHLEKENQLSFVPSGFDFFDKLMAAQNVIRDRLTAEIDSKSKMHDLGPMFVNGNDVGTFIEELSAETALTELNTLCTLSDKEITHLNELKARLATLEASDKTTQVEELAAELKHLGDFLEKVKAAFGVLGKEEIVGYGTAIDVATEFDELAKAEGIQSLAKYDIAEIGSAAWRSFIQAGRVYVDAIEKVRSDVGHPSDEDNCLFCLQSLGDEQKALVQAYWDLLKSNAQAELKKATLALGEIHHKLCSLPELVFDETSSVFATVKKFDTGLAVNWEEIIGRYNETRLAAIAAIDDRAAAKLPQAMEGSVTDFDPCLEKLSADKAALIESNLDEEKAEIQSHIALFDDRILLGKVKEKVEIYIVRAKWAAKARMSTSTFTPTKITKISGTLYDKHVTEEYLAVFNEECSQLDAPKFVKISQRNTKGNTVRSLKIEGKSAMKVLSEGEQRAIALADFITEARLDPYNRGLFFDDPVSSQDHERRERIAGRLVEIAKSRQVIIFTHDIAFFLRLLNVAENELVTVDQNYMLSNGGSPGMIYSELPWIAQRVKARIASLRKDLDVLIKTEKVNDPDRYERELKSWYGRLRETWERAVEERLLKGVVERFAPGIQTQKLKSLDITPDLLLDIERGMTNSSQWLHDAAAGLNPKLPDTAQAKKDLEEIDAFAAKCKAP
ncbi:MAG: AAA family ATPase [Pyrinomonadaceae bacterium]